jgi:hypothetical protein
MNPDPHLKSLAYALTDVDFYVDTEMVGEDARHVCEDVKGAMRQIARIEADHTPGTPDVTLLSDRVAAIRCQLNILTNNLNATLAAMERAEEALEQYKAQFADKEEDDIL